MANNAEIIAAIEKMTILELADLVKEMEEKFGVSAAAPVVVGGAVAGGAVVLGLYGLEDRAVIEEYYARLGKNHPESLECAPLLALNEARGGVKKPHCDALVYEVIQVVEEMLREQGKLAE